MAENPPAAPQGAPKPALAPIDSGYPTAGSPGTNQIVFPNVASPIKGK